MSEQQKLVLILGLVAFVAMGVYPPWILEETGSVVASTVVASSGVILQRPLGYGWIWNDPNPSWGSYSHAHLDLARLLVQWTMVLAFVAVLYVVPGIVDSKTKPN